MMVSDELFSNKMRNFASISLQLLR